MRLSGEQPTVVDKQGWESALDYYFQSAASDEKGTSKGKKLRKAPRTTTLDYINALDNALDGGLGRRLHDFAEDKAFLANPVVLGSRQVSGTANNPEPTQIPATLTICTDEGSPQIAMMYFLLYELRLLMVAFRDPAHRCWNDVGNALKSCNLYSTILTSTLVFNLHYGPWKGAAWFSQIIDAATDMVTFLDPDDRLLVSVWDSICVDRGWHGSDATGAEARSVFLAGLQDVRAVTNKGPQVAGARWFSWMHAAAFWDKEWHTRLVLLLFICIQNGVLNARSTLFRSATKPPVPDDAPDPGLQPGPAGSSGSGAASSSGQPAVHASGPEAASSSHQARVPAAVAEGQPKVGTAQDTMAAQAESLAEKRKKCKNTMHLALTLLADSDMLWRVRLILLTCEPITAMHTEYMSELTSPSQVLACYVKWATWQWLPVLHKVVGILSDAAKLKRIGFKVAFGHITATSDQAKQRAHHEDASASEMAQLVFHLVKNRACSMLYYCASYPGMLAAILAEDPVVSKVALEKLREHTAAFEAAKGQAIPAVQRLVERCVLGWPVMLVVAHLAKAGEWELTPELKQFLLDIFQMYGNSVIIEKAFHHARDEETRGQSSKTMSRLRRWSVPVRHCVLSEFQRAEVEPTTTLPVPGSVPEKLFKVIRTASNIITNYVTPTTLRV